GEAVAITRHDPDIKLRVRELQPRCDRGRAAVDRVEAVGVHVVREAARAADPADEDRILFLLDELREDTLHGGEDRVITATRAPAHLLIGGEISTAEGDIGAHRSSSFFPRRASISSTISLILKGCPAILLKPLALMRSSARRSRTS